MEFKLPIPKLNKDGVLLQHWKKFCERFEYYRRTNSFLQASNLSTASVLLFACHDQVPSLYEALKAFDIDCPKLSMILQVVESHCLPYFILLYERFRYFTLIKDMSEAFQNLAVIVRKQAEICEFGDLSDSLAKALTDDEMTKLCSSRPPKFVDGAFIHDHSSSVNAFEARASLLKADGEGSFGKLGFSTDLPGKKYQSHVDFLMSSEPSSLSSTNDNEIADNLRTKRNSITHSVAACYTFTRGSKEVIKSHNVATQDDQGKSKLKLKTKSAGQNIGQCKPYSCILCSKMFKSDRYLERHIRSKHKSCMDLTCEFCKRTCVNATDFIRHHQDHALKQTVTSAIPETDRHFASAGEADAYGCDYCSQTYSKDAFLKRHMSISHPDCTGFLCWNCHEALPDLAAYKHHCEMHIVKNQFTCELCLKKHHSITRLIGHLKNHLISRLKCDVCSMVFSKLRYVEKHREKHVNEQAYECHLCGKTFLTNTRLQYHKRCHTGEKRYTCELCGKSFSQKTSFTYHKLWHTGVKPYACDICGQQYRSPGDLNRHKGKHSNKRVHVCELCGKGFRYGSSLVEHRKGHSDERSYQCKNCLKTFIYRSGLRNHIREARCPGSIKVGEQPRERAKNSSKRNVSKNFSTHCAQPKGRAKDSPPVEYVETLDPEIWHGHDRR